MHTITDAVLLCALILKNLMHTGATPGTLKCRFGIWNLTAATISTSAGKQYVSIVAFRFLMVLLKLQAHGCASTAPLQTGTHAYVLPAEVVVVAILFIETGLTRRA